MRVFQVLFSIFVFLVGAVALVMPRGYSVGFYLIFLSGFLHWIFSRNELICEKNRWLIWPCISYGVGHAAIVLSHEWAWRSLDPYWPFLLIAFGFWAIRRYRPSLFLLWIGLAVGAVGASVFAGYQSMVLGQRASGYLTTIQFGDAALLFGVLCLVRALNVRGNKWMDGLMLLGVVAGLAASVWSQSRGGWVALLLILGWMLLIVGKSWSFAKRLTVSFAVLVVIALPVLQPEGIVQKRVQEAVQEVEHFIDTNEQGTSVGARLAMWEFAAKDILKSPFFGVGAQGWIKSRDSGVESGVLNPYIQNFNQLHNEYLDVAYKTGLAGLLLLIALYCVPMLQFFKPYLHVQDAEVRALAMGGMVLPMMYMDFGLTQAFLSHNSGRMVFVSLLMCLGALLLNRLEDQSQ